MILKKKILHWLEMIIVKNKGFFWHFDLTTDKWRLKSDYVSYKHKLKYQKFSDDWTFVKKELDLVG